MKDDTIFSFSGTVTAADAKAYLAKRKAPQLVLPAAKAERIRHALMFAMRAAQGLGDEFDAASFSAADIDRPDAMEAITRAAGQDDAEEYAEIIAMIDNQIGEL